MTGLLKSFLFGVMAALAVIACDMSAHAQIGFGNQNAAPPGFLVANSIADTGVSLTSTVAANITSVSLPPGDWDCYGYVQDKPAGGTTSTLFTAGISLTTATQPALGFAQSGASISAGIVTALAVPTTRVVVTSGNTSVFLVATSTFAVSTKTAGGALSCRNMVGYR
jgi:hypothetical protein